MHTSSKNNNAALSKLDINVPIWVYQITLCVFNTVYNICYTKSANKREQATY